MLRRQRVDAHPERRQLATDAPRGRRARVEQRHAGHDRVGVRLRELRDARNGGEIVLSVGVDLQRVRAAGDLRRGESRDHGDSLAAIHRAADQREPAGFASRDVLEHGPAARVAAVVHEPARQSVRLERRDGLTDGVLVVIERDDQAQADCRRIHGRRILCARWSRQYPRARTRTKRSGRRASARARA